jgi:hypothetical protein
MLARSILAAAGVLACAGPVYGQAAAPVPVENPQSAWRSAPGGESPAASAAGVASPTSAVTPNAAAGANPALPEAGATRKPVTRFTTGNGQLPNEHGQLWREYDISPYTVKVDSTARPEQAIVDWILRETGYESWHSQPLSILSAPNRNRLLVYHTEQMQAVVAGIVDRFVSVSDISQAFALRLVTVDHPNWRARAQRLLQPIQVQTPGVQAWMLHKEDAAILLAQLQRRSDYREHSSPHLVVNNGQSAVVSATRARSYIHRVAMRPEAWPGFEPQTAVVDEGYSLEFSPLLSIDGSLIDAAIKCTIDQVEKMVPVTIDVPTVVAPRQRTQIEVPQMAQFRFHERFRWPVDQVLLVGLGMIPLPVPSEGKSLVPGIPLPLPKSTPRADVLIFVEVKGKTGDIDRITQAGSATPPAAPGSRR